jgi:hypothetical protein
MTCKTATITFRNRQLKFKHLQFPIVEACAMNVHKSQGTTFDKIVFNYEWGLDQQLVYVGLSRVTSIHWLSLTNHNSDYTFNHWKGSSTPKIKYLRLERHKQLNITDRAKQFLQRVSSEDFTMTALNSQSLPSHSADVSTDPVLGSTDVLALTETWTDNEETVPVDGYKCRTTERHSWRSSHIQKEKIMPPLWQRRRLNYMLHNRVETYV